ADPPRHDPGRGRPPLAMSRERHLGAGWAAIHGPAEPRALAVWVLERGFRGVLAGPTARPVDWRALRRAAEDLPFRFADALRLASATDADDRPAGGLGSRNRGDVEAAKAAILAAVGRARA